MNTSSPNTPIYASRLIATGASPSIDAVIQPKNTGAFLVNLADGTSTGGDKRGSNAVDLQSARSNSVQVASGDYSFIPGGRNNEAQGDYSIAVGYGAKATNHAERAYSSGNFASAGDAQEMTLIYRGVTIDSNPTDLYLDGTSLLAAIPSDTTWTMECLVVARRTDTDGDSAGYKLYFTMDRSSLASSVALVGSIDKKVIAEDSNWDINVTADITSGGPLFRATGEAGKNIRWVVSARVVQVTG